MRIIAGTYRSRVLKTLKGRELRPTSDRLRETLFNVLGSAVRGSRFLDIFAGTGAVGIEALSRGAAGVVFIEKHKAAATLIWHNLESLGVRSGTQVLSTDALRGLQKLESGHSDPPAGFDFVFLDPPYAQAEEYARVLRLLGSSRILGRGGTVIAEHHKKTELAERFGRLERTRILREGDAVLSFYRWAETSETPRKPVSGSEPSQNS